MSPVKLGTWLTVGMIAWLPSAAHGAYDTVLTTGHADIDLAYEASAWELLVHDHDADTEYDPGSALMYVGEAARTNRPASNSFDFIGVGPDQPYWRLPQNENPLLLFLGISTAEIEEGTFDSWSVTDPRLNETGPFVILSLIDVRGPGDFSIWTSTDEGPLVWMSTAADGITADDKLYQLSGSHSHHNMGFTKAGLYEVDFRATAFLGPGATNPVTSEITTYHFGVETVPEPGSWILFAVGGLLSAFALARRQRHDRP